MKPNSAEGAESLSERFRKAAETDSRNLWLVLAPVAAGELPACGEAPPQGPVARAAGEGGLNAGSGLRCLVSALRLRGTTRRIPCLVFLRSYRT